MSILLTGASIVAAFGALLLERFFGYPDFLLRAVGHPVMWIGAVVALMERGLNRPGRAANRLLGVLAVAFVLALVLLVTVPLTLLLRALPGGVIAEMLLAASLLSQQELGERVESVAAGLDESLERGRADVAHIVGRDPETLDGHGVARAAIESLAENASDGIVAPLFWLVVAGLPGMALYKAVNTADSMIGYRSERYRAFGWAAARLDDVMNYLPARLTGLLVVAASAMARGADPAAAAAVMRRDAPRHVSPNAGWPEAAMAGALALRLGGPRSYEGAPEDGVWLGEGSAEAGPADIRRALRLYRRMLDLLAAMTFVAAAFFIRF